MRHSLNALVRLAALLTLVSGTVAVAMARLAPTPAHFRMATPPHYGVINGFVMESELNTPRFLDAATGAVRKLVLPEGDRFEYGACSPWVDEQGESQVVGRWMREATASGTPHQRLYDSFGLARYALPSGRVLNRIALEVLPLSHPCWFPDMTARVIYAGGDGHLYLLDFTATDRADAGDDPTPRRVLWQCARPGAGLMIADPVWSGDPRLGRRLIVSLRYDGGAASGAMKPAQLWWVSLSPDGRAVVDAGALTGGGTSAEAGRPNEERFPNLAATPDGTLVLAHFARATVSNEWTLRLSPVDFDGTGGAPRVRPGSDRVIADGLVSVLTPFSADGRWLYGIPRHSPSDQVVRFPTTSAAALTSPAD